MQPTGQATCAASGFCVMDPARLGQQIRVRKLAGNGSERASLQRGLISANRHFCTKPQQLRLRLAIPGHEAIDGVQSSTQVICTDLKV